MPNVETAPSPEVPFHVRLAARLLRRRRRLLGFAAGLVILSGVGGILGQVFAGAVWGAAAGGSAVLALIVGGVWFSEREATRRVAHLGQREPLLAFEASGVGLVCCFADGLFVEKGWRFIAVGGNLEHLESASFDEGSRVLTVTSRWTDLDGVVERRTLRINVPASLDRATLRGAWQQMGLPLT